MLNFKNHSIQDCIEKQDWTALHAAVHSLPPAEIAEILMTIEKPEERVILFRMLPKAVAADVAAQMELDDVNALLKHLTDDETRRLLAHLSPDDRTSLFEELPGRLAQQLINLLSPDDLREVRTLLGYPEMSVGRLMTPDYVAVRPEWTVGQALARIRQKGSDSETINMILVVDKEWNLLDTVELRKFILADPETPVQSIMDYSFVSMRPTDDREKAVEAMLKYDLIALPVVDSDGVLLGIVADDDIMDVAQEEATEDFQKSAAVLGHAPQHGFQEYRSLEELASWQLVGGRNSS
ncbi:MAG: CBS domain-containing protein [Bacillota bacterium]|nr:CBS domain-containing protein [Bacillota bacterium]